MKSARENIQKSARERKNLPVNFSKKCPWTQKHAREHFWKSEVRGHFWGSRVKKNTAQHSMRPPFQEGYLFGYNKGNPF